MQNHLWAQEHVSKWGLEVHSNWNTQDPHKDKEDHHRSRPCRLAIKPFGITTLKIDLRGIMGFFRSNLQRSKAVKLCFISYLEMKLLL